MSDTIGTKGMATITPDKGYDRRHWRDKNSSDWPTLTLETREGILRARQLMGLPHRPVLAKECLVLFVEPEAIILFIKGWDTSHQTGDERFLEVINRRPCPVYLKRGVNQILAHKSKC